MAGSSPIDGRAAVALALIAAPIALCACGGSSQRSGDSLAARRALGRKALLVRSDLIAGWTADGAARGAAPVREDEMAACTGVPAAQLASGPAEVRAPLFTRGTTQLTNSVTVSGSVAQAEATFALFNRPDSGHCLGVVLARSLPAILTRSLPAQPRAGGSAPAVAPGRPRVRRLTVVSESDTSIGYRIVLPLAVYGHRSDLTFDLVVLRIGRGLSYLLYGGGKALDAATERRLNIVVSQRLRAALAAR